MKLNEKINEENFKTATDLVTPGYVKQMINRFSSGNSNEDAKRNPSSICSFKVPLLHSTRSNFKSEKPKPFHYPVLLANRSSIPTKPFFDKPHTKNGSSNDQSSPGSKSSEEYNNFGKSSLNGMPNNNSNVRSSSSVKLDDDSGKYSSSAGSSLHTTEVLNGFSEPESFPPTKSNLDETEKGEFERIAADTYGANLKNGNYFLQLMGEKEKVLNDRCAEFDSWLGPDVPDEVSGKIRAAIGKANLLTSKKFNQFAGLCHSNMTSTQEGQFQVTCEDLEGFWDLVMIQVSDVETLFAELTLLRSNGWKESKTQNELHQASTSHKQETPTRSRDATTPAKASARKGKASEFSAEKMRLRAAMQAGRRQRKTSQNEDDVQIFIAEKS